MSSKDKMSSPVKSSPKGLDKKKESEAANLAKRKKEFGGELDPKKTLICQGWEQTETHVIVTLFAGKKMGNNEIEVDYNQQDVLVSLTDGRKWYCQFQHQIEKTLCRVQLQKLKVFLRAKKKDVGLKWTSLEYDPDIITAPPVAPPRKQTAAKKKIVPESSKLDSKSTSEQTPLLQENFGELEPINEVTKIQKTGEKMDTETSGSHPVIPPPPPLPSMFQKKDIEMTEKGITETKSSKDSATEVVFDLDHVKNDYYERGADSIVAIIYVKQIDKDTLRVDFQSQDISVRFRTKSANFLAMYEGSNDHTIFQWKIKVVDDIVPDKCTVKVTDTQVALTLVKLDARKWGALEASQAKGAHVFSTNSEWQLTNKQATMVDNTSSKDDLEGVGIGPSKTSKQIINENTPSTSATRSSILSETKETPSQKPTCMVSPLNKHVDTVPMFSLGMTGLDNLGNTCFLNSVVQVLANTKELRDYFIGGMFQKEINHDNPLGAGGKLAVSFATLMKIIWSGKHRSYPPAKLKNLVGMKNSQFLGFAQHDAQEFMAYLLDGLHEDVNRVRNKPYTSEVDSDGRPDEVVADEAWERHKSRNDSFIVDLFQGQYKSKLVCPECGKVSITFDPFMHLSVPLPKKKKFLLPVIFMSRDPYKKPVKYVLRLSKDAAVDDLKELVFQLTGVHPCNLMVFEANKHKIHCFLHQGNNLACIKPTDEIYVCEMLGNKLAGEQVLQIPCVQRTVQPVSMPTKCSNCKRECSLGEKLKRCTKCLRTAYCDQQCQKRDWPRHKANCIVNNECVGQPFVISIPKSQATYSRLAQTMEAFSRHSLDVFQPPVTQTSLGTSSGPQCESTTPSTSCPSAPTTITHIPSTDSITTESLNNTDTAQSQLSSESQNNTETDQCQLSSESQNSDLSSEYSQATSTTEVVSSSSDASFITVDSGMEDNSRSSLDGNLTNLESDTAQNNMDPESEPINVAMDEYSAGKSATQTSSSSNVTSPPTGYVMGRQQDAEKVEQAFSIRPCTRDGKMIPGKDGNKLEDKGEEPLDLSEIRFLAMDWRNHEKCKPYVLVQSKDLEYDEDESVRTAPAEESSNITLDKCLSLFTEPEVLSPDHAWYCPKCKEHREATKQLSIWRLPAYLIIQLKRFSFSSFIWRDKIDKMVEYPIRGLDLKKHFMGKLPSNEPPPIYDLYGVVNHMGGILGGHYTSYARCPDTVDWKRSEIGWRLFDDSMVSLVSENQTMTRAGYVLFYRRRNMTVSLPPAVEEHKAIIEPVNEDDKPQPEQQMTDYDEQPSTFLSNLAPMDNHYMSGSGDATVVDNTDNRYATPIDPQSGYSFTDMDTVD